jgi:uncharacterized lipoprotein YddW (UPF0748 family)
MKFSGNYLSHRSLFIGFLGIAIVFALSIPIAADQSDQPQQKKEVHALWAHPMDVQKNVESVRAFVAKCKRAHIDRIVMDVKDSDGGIYWKSKRFPQAIAKGWENFDLLGNLVREAHAAGIKVDAWLVDFSEGANGAAFREHPEWAELNSDGETMLSEKLGKTRPYPYVWMCPARRPGYVDQWLLPMFEEIAANYDVDSVHHDYVRYPGDVAPDSYCFCDYCLKHIPRYAMLSYESLPEERYRVNPAQPRIEANWWSDPTMLPADWDKMDRREKANFILNGQTIPGGPPDMRYFFYDYRAHQIETFVREVAQNVKRINPKIQTSAAVFKNPILSGRFLGQHWDQWTPWIDVYMPMTYRSHFAGNFDSYLAHLTEMTERQMEWVRNQRPIYAGIASTYLYREELKPWDDIRDRINEFQGLLASDTKGRAEKAQIIKTAYELGKSRLAQYAPQVEREVTPLINTVTANDGRNATPEAVAELSRKLAVFRADLPAGFLPPEKLRLSIEAARKANPQGIAIFAASSLTREKLWGVLEEEFK